MLSQLVFFSPELHEIISDLIYADLKYPGEINHPNPSQDPPLPGKPFQLSMLSYILPKAR